MSIETSIKDLSPIAKEELKAVAQSTALHELLDIEICDLERQLSNLDPNEDNFVDVYRTTLYTKHYLRSLQSCLNEYAINKQQGEVQ